MFSLKIFISNPRHFAILHISPDCVVGIYHLMKTHADTGNHQHHQYPPNYITIPFSLLHLSSISQVLLPFPSPLSQHTSWTSTQKIPIPLVPISLMYWLLSPPSPHSHGSCKPRAGYATMKTLAVPGSDSSILVLPPISLHIPTCPPYLNNVEEMVQYDSPSPLNERGDGPSPPFHFCSLLLV
ncbi:unnamed protein product [Prunus armeniaca]